MLLHERDTATEGWGWTRGPGRPADGAAALGLPPGTYAGAWSEESENQRFAFEGLPMAVYQLDDWVPEIAASAWVADSASVIGRVRALDEGASVWYGAVLRGDNDQITLGRNNATMQDGSVLHTDPDLPLTLGENVTVGRQVMLHGCHIGDGTLVIQAVVLNGAKIEAGAASSAPAPWSPKQGVPDGSLIVGAPAKGIGTAALSAAQIRPVAAYRRGTYQGATQRHRPRPQAHRQRVDELHRLMFEGPAGARGQLCAPGRSAGARCWRGARRDLSGAGMRALWAGWPRRAADAVEHRVRRHPAAAGCMAMTR